MRPPSAGLLLLLLRLPTTERVLAEGEEIELSEGEGGEEEEEGESDDEVGEVHV